MDRAGEPNCANDRAKGRRALPFSYEIDTKNGVAKLTASGIVTDDDLSALVDELWADPDWRIDMPTLTDFSAAVALEFTPDGIRGVFELLTTKRGGLSRGGIKSAVVVTETGQKYLVKMGQAMASSIPDMSSIQTFSSPEEAWDWLGLPET